MNASARGAGCRSRSSRPPASSRCCAGTCYLGVPPVLGLRLCARILRGGVVSAVAGFSVRGEVDGPAAFAVVDPNGRLVPELGAFLRDLAERDRSAYTQRAYALGLADFFGWLAARGLALEAADRSVVSAYIADFRAGDKGGATGSTSRGSGGSMGARASRRRRSSASRRRRSSASRRRSITGWRCWRRFLRS